MDVPFIKKQYQDEFNGYYDEEYEKVAKLMGFDYDAENGIRIPERFIQFRKYKWTMNHNNKINPKKKLRTY